MDKKEIAAYNNLMKAVKARCAENNIALIFDKLENEGGSCKYKDKTYIFLNKIYDDPLKLKTFFSELESAGNTEAFLDLKETFLKLNAQQK